MSFLFRSVGALISLYLGLISLYMQLPHFQLLKGTLGDLRNKHGTKSKCTTARWGGYSTKFCFYLVNLFNRILDTGKYPALWSFGLIVPIHKKDDRSKVANYRGITLLSALGKLFTSIILYKAGGSAPR